MTFNETMPYLQQRGCVFIRFRTHPLLYFSRYQIPSKKTYNPKTRFVFAIRLSLFFVCLHFIMNIFKYGYNEKSLYIQSSVIIACDRILLQRM